ncbi:MULTISPECIES: hypothetical protein [unclassified Spiroplasma]|uniref:hypothetical protein n=1 Tax=unclassified Spiroplasma TaxID=2637901 RepID=UPI00313EEB05
MHKKSISLLMLIIIYFINISLPLVISYNNKNINRILKANTNEWIAMEPIINKDYNLNPNDVASIHNAISQEMNDIIPRFNNNETDTQYYRAGFLLTEEKENQLGVFLYFNNSSSIQVYFQYFKDITKAEIINVMKNNSLAKILHLQDETELQNIEMLRDTLYSYIGKTINVQRELINISKLRLKFIKIEQNPHNPNFWTAYFNYFNNADLIPLQIYIFKPQKQHPELPTSITNNKRKQFIIKVIEWFKTVFNVTISIATLLSLLALGTIGNGLGIGGSLSLLQAGTSLISTAQTNTLDMFNISRENTFNTELTELEYDISDELTSLLPSRNETTNFIETTIKEPQAPFNFLENTANQWKTISRMKQDSQPLNFSKILASWDNYQEEIFRFITNIYPSNINHNMDYLRWGRFDKYRIGKIKYTFSNFEFNIPLENVRFTNPSSELITAFKEKVKDIFQGVKFKLNEVQNCKNNSNLMSLLIPYLLIGNSGVMIQNEKHYFSTDSFWISNYEIINNEKITVYLEHILFNEPLMISFNLF